MKEKGTFTYESFCSPEVACTGVLKKSKDGFSGFRFFAFSALPPTSRAFEFRWFIALVNLCLLIYCAIGPFEEVQLKFFFSICEDFRRRKASFKFLNAALVALLRLLSSANWRRQTSRKLNRLTGLTVWSAYAAKISYPGCQVCFPIDLYLCLQKVCTWSVPVNSIRILKRNQIRIVHEIRFKRINRQIKRSFRILRVLPKRTRGKPARSEGRTFSNFSLLNLILCFLFL